MGIPSQAVQRISIRWLPEPAYEDTDTIALNVGGWTHIIDSLDLTVPDEAHFEKLPNGDDLEVGITPCPHKGGAQCDYEEVWRDITAKSSTDEPSWILQSRDETAFIGKIGSIFLAIRKSSNRAFSARREDRNISSQKWDTTYEFGNAIELPRVDQVIEIIEMAGEVWVEGQMVNIGETGYIFKAVSAE
ncbi:hypothetical protein TruAng_005497 [Truncatella angustata]|nr:hypothetical protein TruAng_005497 [Truncatella angustata]